MDKVPGSVGTGASLALRVAQTIFSSASLLFMSVGVPFYSYTSFCSILATYAEGFTERKHRHSTCLCFLVTIMGLVIPWSLTLALVDGYHVLVKCPIHRPGMGIMLFIIIGDWALSILSLAGACSTASVVDLLLGANVSYFPQKVCSRYQISAAMAFLSWSLSLASSLFNLWLLPYL